MSQQNPDYRTINIKTQEGLDLLKIKAKYYGHYAEFLKVMDLIKEIEELREAMDDLRNHQEFHVES